MNNKKYTYNNENARTENIKKVISTLIAGETGVWHLLITPNLNNPLFKPTMAYFFVKFFQILCGYMCLYMI